MPVTSTCSRSGLESGVQPSMPLGCVLTIIVTRQADPMKFKRALPEPFPEVSRARSE